MPSVTEGNSQLVTIPANRTLKVKSTSEAHVLVEFGIKHVVGPEGFELHSPDVPRRVTVSAFTGIAKYTVFYSDVVPFTGDFTLAEDDDGKVFRCDDPSNVTVTVPASLPECFSVAFAMWDAGTVTIAAGSGATKRSSTSALSTQYQWGSVTVIKNANDSSAEFVLGGDFA